MRCPACGANVEDSSSYCVKCGASLKATTRSEGEEYLGGVHSSDIYKNRLPWNYAIHATNKRLLAVKLGLGDRVGGFSLTHYCRVFKPKSKEKNAEKIRELDEKSKDFELLKEEVSGIEMKNPKMVIGTGGYIRITRKDGSEINLEIHVRRSFKYLRELLTRFSGKVSVV